MPMEAPRPFRVVVLRELYQEVETETVFRVVYTGLGQEYTYLADILGKRLCIRRYRTVDFREMADENNPRRAYVPFEADPYSTSRRVAAQTPRGAAKAQRNWAVLSPLVESYNEGTWVVRDLVDDRTRYKVLREYSRVSGHGVPLLYSLLRRYLQRGMTESALHSDYGNCGAARTNAVFTSREGQSGLIESNPVRRRYTRRPGAPPANPVYQYALPSEELLRLINIHLDIYATWKRGAWHAPPAAKALGKRLRQRPRHENGLIKISARQAVKARLPSKDHRPVRGRRSKPTLQDLADSINFMLRRETALWDGPKLTLVKLAQRNIVTVRQVQWQWAKSLPDFVRRRKRHPNEHEVERRIPLPGRARQHVSAPGQLVLIDSTVVDAYVVSPLDRRLVLGRPVLYLAIDLYSGLIVGLHLGLENPSREAAALTLVNMLTSKKDFCAEYGLEIDEQDWPAHYLPFEIGADRGAEFTATEPWANMARQFGVGIANSPVRTPAARGLAERRFGILSRGYQKASFGTVERDFGTRLAKRYAWDACYTCAELTTMLLRAIDVYHRHPSSGDQPPPVEMVLAGLADTPLNRWRWGVENAGGMLRAVDPEEMRLATWPKDRARLYRNGILFKGAWYLCKPLQEEFLDTDKGKGKKRGCRIEIQYDPTDMAEIRVPLYGYHEVAVVDPNRNSYPLSGISLAEWSMIRAANRVNRRRKLDEEQEHRIVTLHNNQVEDELAEATQREALKAANARHPDDSDMKQQRAKVRALATKAEAFAKSVGAGGADMSSDTGHAQDADSTGGDDPFRDVMYETDTV